MAGVICQYNIVVTTVGRFCQFFIYGIVSNSFHLGYGHITPKTTGGRIFCIVFAFLGIPLMGVFLVGIGTKITKPIKTFKNMSKNKYTRVLKSIVIFIVGVIVLISIPASVFHFVEKWKFLDAVYFAVITLTTVGFGDFVAGKYLLWRDTRKKSLRVQYDG